MYSWKPSKASAKEYAEKMTEIDNFCRENNISKSLSNDSYYFIVNGQKYRVSNHTPEASDRGAFNDYGEQIRSFYHNGRAEDVIYITAGKTRIIEIFNNIKSGKELDGRGNVVKEAKKPAKPSVADKLNNIQIKADEVKTNTRKKGDLSR